MGKLKYHSPAGQDGSRVKWIPLAALFQLVLANYNASSIS